MDTPSTPRGAARRASGPCRPGSGGGAGRGRTTRCEAWGWPVRPARRWWPPSWASCRCGGWCAAGCARSAARRSRRRPRRRPGPAARPGAGGGRRPSSQIGVGQDFPDQRGHGPLVRGGHRGCTPCESWSRNRTPTMPAALPGRRAPRRRGPRGNCHHTKRRTPGPAEVLGANTIARPGHCLSRQERWFGSARWRGRNPHPSMNSSPPLHPEAYSGVSVWGGWGSCGESGRGCVQICRKGAPRRDRRRTEARNINASSRALRLDTGLCGRFGQTAPPRAPGGASWAGAPAGPTGSSRRAPVPRVSRVPRVPRGCRPLRAIMPIPTPGHRLRTRRAR